MLAGKVADNGIASDRLQGKPPLQQGAIWLWTSITDPKVSRTLNAYSSTTNIKVNKRSFDVIEKGKN